MELVLQLNLQPRAPDQRRHAAVGTLQLPSSTLLSSFPAREGSESLPQCTHSCFAYSCSTLLCFFCLQVVEQKKWVRVRSVLGIPDCATSASFLLNKLYRR